MPYIERNNPFRSLIEYTSRVETDEGSRCHGAWSVGVVGKGGEETSSGAQSCTKRLPMSRSDYSKPYHVRFPID